MGNDIRWACNHHMRYRAGSSRSYRRLIASTTRLIAVASTFVTKPMAVAWKTQTAVYLHTSAASLAPRYGSSARNEQLGPALADLTALSSSSSPYYAYRL